MLLKGKKNILYSEFWSNERKDRYGEIGIFIIQISMQTFESIKRAQAVWNKFKFQICMFTL